MLPARARSCGRRFILSLASAGLACSSAPVRNADDALAGTGGAPSNGGTRNAGGSLTANGGQTGAGGAQASGGWLGLGGQGAGVAIGGSGPSGGLPNSGGAATPSGGDASGGSASVGGSPHGGPLKVMAIGDSITQSTCWRALLWQSLSERAPSAYEFVGSTLNDSGCSPSTYDKDSQAYGSSLLTQAISGNFSNPSKTCSPQATSTANCPALVDFTNAFDEFAPDIALIHYGTNDVWENRPNESIIDGYSQLVDGLRASNPSVRVLLAQIIPLSESACSACRTSVPALNTAIVSFANTKTTTNSPVVVVDQFSGFDTQADTRDGVHPNDAGSAKMASQWLTAFESL